MLGLSKKCEKNGTLLIAWLFLVVGIFLPAHFSFDLMRVISSNTYAADTIWTGAVSPDWADAGNWSLSAIPTAADNVTIPDSSTTNNDPNISSGAVCLSMTIDSGGVLNGNGQTITVKGNWTNNGTFNHGNGTVKFYKDDSSTFTPGLSDYYNVEVDQTYGSADHDRLNVSGTVNLVGDLIHTDGRMLGGQINLSGNYIIGAAASASYGASAAVTTIVNFNSATNNQTITYTAGGVGTQVRIDKTGGTFSLTSNITVSGWTYVQGTVSGVDSHTITFGGNGNGTFTPGNIVYGGMGLNKVESSADYDHLNISGTVSVSGDFNHIDGRTLGGQINLSGNYIIGAAASASYDSSGSVSTIVNFNSTTNNQTITYAAGGVGTQVRIDKTGGTFSLAGDIAVSGWTYVQGTVSGVNSHTITFGGRGNGTFTPGTLTYGSIALNNTTASATYDNLTIGSGTLNISGSLTVNDGEILLNTNNVTANISGDVIIAAAGQIDAGTNTITVSGNWTNSGIFNHGNGAIKFIGSDNKIFTPGTSGYYNVEVDKANRWQVSGTATISGNFIHTNGSLGFGQVDLAGNYVVAAGADGAPDDWNSTVINFNGTGDQTIVYTSGGIAAQVRMDKASGTFSLNDNVVFDGWTYIQGTVSGLDTHTLIFGDDANGGFTPGSLTYGNIELNKISIACRLNTSGTVTVSGNFTQTAGAMGFGQFNLSGNYIIGAGAKGSPDDWTSTVINFNGTGDQTIVYNSGGIAPQIRIDKASGTLILGSDITVDGWAYIQGTVSGVNTHTLTFGDDTGGSFTFGSLVYGNIIVNKTNHYGSRDDLVLGAGSLNVSGNLTITEGEVKFDTNNPSASIYGSIIISTNGILDAGTNTITVSGDWTNSGTFNHGNGTVVFTGNSNSTFTGGSSIYNNIEVNKTNGGWESDHLSVADTISVLGNFTHNDGRLLNGQINLAGNYIIGAGASALYPSNASTVINLNDASSNQSINSSGGVGACVQINKTGGSVSLQNNITLGGWIYVAGTVNNLNTYDLTLSGSSNGVFTPGNLIYNNLTVNYTNGDWGNDHLSISGTATLTGNLIQTDGRLLGGQINLAGNYIIGDGASGSYPYATSTVINFNHPSNAQTISGSIGTGAHVYVDKTGGSVSLVNDISVNDWTYIKGVVNGLATHTLTFGGSGNGVFVPGSMIYGNIVLNKTASTDWDDLVVGSGTLNCSSVTINDGELKFNTNNTIVNISGNVTIAAAGQMDAGTNSITVSGSWTNSGIFNHGNGKILFAQGSADSTFTPGSSSYNDLELNKSNGYADNLTVSSTATVLGNLTHTDGDLGGGQIDLAGNYTIGALANGGPNTGVPTIINFSNAADQAVTCAVGGVGAHIYVNKTGGTLTVPDSLFVVSWTYVQGTVAGMDGNSLLFADDSNGIFTPGALVYHDIVMNKLAGYSDNLDVSGTAEVAGDVTHIDGEMRGGQLDVSGNYTIGAMADGAVNSGAATIINLNHASNDQEISCAGGIGDHVRVDKAGGILTISTDVTVVSWTYVRGTVAGTQAHALVFKDDYGSVFVPGSLTYGDIEVNKTNHYGAWDDLTIGTGSLDVLGNFIFTEGQLHLESNNPSIDLGGNLTLGSNATVTKGTGIITFNGTHPAVFTDANASSQDIGKVVLNKTNTDEAQNRLTLASSLTCDTFSIDGTAGEVDTLDLGSGGYMLTIASAGSVADPFSLSGIMVPGNSTVKYAATDSAGNLDLAPGPYFNLDLSGAETYVLTADTNVSGSLAVEPSAALDTAAYDLTLSGDFNGAGTFTPHTNTVTLSGDNQSILGSNSFYNLNKTATAPSVLTFASGTTTHILAGGTLSLSGKDQDNRLTLQSSQTSTAFNLNVPAGAATNLDYLTVTDSNASGIPLTALNSQDGGGNTNWTIISNTPSTLTVPILSQGTDGRGTATLETNISDTDGDSVSLKVEYSPDNGNSWLKPYLTGITASIGTPILDNDGEYQITDISTSDLNHLTLSWDSKNILNEGGAISYSDQIKVRLSVWDGLDISSALSATFTLDDAAPTDLSLFALTPTENTLTLTATAIDPSGPVTYLFTRTSPSPTASSWQESVFTDAGLSPNTLYAYTVKAKDKWGNESDSTPLFSLYTLAQTPAGVTLESLSPTEIKVSWQGGQNPENTEYLVSAEGINSDWINATSFTFSGLTPSTSYTFTIKARNEEGIETALSTGVSISTLNSSSFILPSKPDVSNVKMNKEGGALAFTALPTNVSQVAISATEDFKDVSWETIAKGSVSLGEKSKAPTLYLKFRTKAGGVSDILTYTQTNGSSLNTFLVEGDIVKTPMSPDVYILKYQGGKAYRRLILSPSVFNSYGHLKWENIKIVSEEEMEKYTLSQLVQAVGDTNIYVLSSAGDTGERRILNTPDYDPDSVYEINSVDRDSYILR